MSLHYLTDALTVCEQILETQPLNQSKFSFACRQIGNILQGMGNFEDASVWNSRALEDEPNLVEISTNIADLYMRQKEWKKALHTYERTLELDPDAAEIHWYVAQLHSHIGDKDKELDSWYQAFMLRPDKATAQRYTRLGYSFHEQGKPDKAIDCFHRAIGMEANFANAYRGIGKVLLSQGKWQEAIDNFNRLWVQDTKQTWALHKIGTIYLQSQKFSEAVTAFRQCIHLDPDFPWAYQSLVSVFLQMKELDKAILTCRAIVKLVGEYPWVYSQMGSALMQAGNTSEAIVSFQKVCELNGWPACVKNDYHFTQDLLTNYIPIWSEKLQPLMGGSGIKALEITVFQGMVTCWLLDNLLTDETTELTCVGEKFNSQFRANLAKTGFSNKVMLLEGHVEKNLASLSGQTYHFIKVQDHARRGSKIQSYAQLTWNLLQVGGIMILKDYQWSNPDSGEQLPKRGIDAFVKSISGQCEILHQNYQVIVKKIANLK